MGSLSQHVCGIWNTLGCFKQDTMDLRVLHKDWVFQSTVHPMKMTFSPYMTSGVVRILSMQCDVRSENIGLFVQIK